VGTGAGAPPVEFHGTFVPAAGEAGTPHFTYLRKTDWATVLEHA